MVCSRDMFAVIDLVKVVWKGLYGIGLEWRREEREEVIFEQDILREKHWNINSAGRQLTIGILYLPIA